MKDLKPQSPVLSKDRSSSLQHTMRSPKKHTFNDTIPLDPINNNSNKHELNQEEIEEFEKANVEDMGIPVNGVALPSSHKFSTQDMDGIILDPIAFHSTDDLKDDLQISNDQYEDNLLYIPSPSSSSDSSNKKNISNSDSFSDSSSSTSSSSSGSATSLFNLNTPSNFLENTFSEESSFQARVLPISHSFITGSNHGINEFDKLHKTGKPIKDEDLYDLVIQYNSSLNKSIIKFDHNKNYETLQTEINDWFTSNELTHLPQYRDLFVRDVCNNDFSKQTDTVQQKTVEKLVHKLNDYYKHQENFESFSSINFVNGVLLSNTNDVIFNKLLYLNKELPVLQQLTYLILGNYGFATGQQKQITQMKHFLSLLIQNGFLNILILNLKKYSKIVNFVDLSTLKDHQNMPQSDHSRKFIETLKSVNEFWFLILTNFYIILNIHLFEFVDYNDQLGKDFELSADVDTDTEAEDKKPSDKLCDKFDKLSLQESQVGQNVLTALKEAEILPYLAQYIEKWRWNNKVLMKIRNIILITNKLILVEFGSMKNYLKTKRYLAHKFNIKTKKEAAKLCTIHEKKKELKKKDIKREAQQIRKLIEEEKEESLSSTVAKTDKKLYAFPLDYYVYSKNLTSRYPAFQPPQPTYPKFLDNNSSLSQFIEVPRTLDNQFLNSSLPVPTVHIATPAPSPTASPQSMAPTTGKGKRSFQTNQAFPFIYPVDGNENVPYSIREASEIFANSVIESFAKKQLWNERVRFMQQERGWKSSINPTSLSLENDVQYTEDDDNDNDFDIHKNPEVDDYDIMDPDAEIAKYPEFKNQILTLVKLEKYYKRLLPTLTSLVHVMVQIIKSNDTLFENNILKEKIDSGMFFQNNDNSNNNDNFVGGGNSNNSIKTSKQDDKIFKQKLEIIKTKEITLKNASSILNLFMKWFKMSHILKAENLGTIIFDSGFVEILLEYISNENFRDKLFNKEVRVQDFEFFAKCQKLSFNSNNNDNNKINNRLYEEAASFYFYDNLLKSDPTLTREFYKAQQLKQLQQKFQTDDKSDLDLSNYLNMSVYETGSSPPQLPNNTSIKNKSKGQIYDTSGKIFNLRYCIILNNLFKILQKIILNKTKRAVSFSEKQPVEIFRIIMGPFYNHAIYKSILKVLKEIIPYNGKKWKSVNMDLISMIYINLNLKLKDNWLSGRDIDSEMGDAEGQELALRALIQFYTARKYEEGIDKFGYERRNSDFFGRETDLIASNEINNEKERLD